MDTRRACSVGSHPMSINVWIELSRRSHAKQTCPCEPAAGVTFAHRARSASWVKARAIAPLSTLLPSGSHPRATRPAIIAGPTSSVTIVSPRRRRARERRIRLASGDGCCAGLGSVSIIRVYQGRSHARCSCPPSIVRTHWNYTREGWSAKIEGRPKPPPCPGIRGIWDIPGDQIWAGRLVAERCDFGPLSGQI